MLLPQELKEKNFSRTMRGYNPAEVDDYLDFIIEKYSELYRENDDLTRKLNAAVAKIEELGSGDAMVRTTLLNAKKAADRIVEEANGRADMILNSVKGRSDAILSEYKEKIAAQQQVLTEIESRIAKFKAVLYEEYSAHIDAIEKLTVSADSLPDDGNYVDAVVAGVKEDLTNAVADEVKENTVALFEDQEEAAIEEESAEFFEESSEEAYTEEDADEDSAEYTEEDAVDYSEEDIEDMEEYEAEDVQKEAKESKKMGFLARHGYTLRKEEAEESSEDEFERLDFEDRGE